MKKRLLALLSLVFLLTLILCSCSLNDAFEKVTVWEVKEGGNIVATFYDGTEIEYEHIRQVRKADTYRLEGSLFSYFTSLFDEQLGEYELYSSEFKGATLYLENDDVIKVYEKSGENAFSYVHRYLTDEKGGKRAEMFYDPFSSLTLSGTPITVDASELRGAKRYFINNVTPDGILTETVGEMFLYNGEYYIVKYSTLGNINFDSEGYLSLRSGTVNLYAPADPTKIKLKDTLNNLKPFYDDYMSEIDYLSGNDAMTENEVALSAESAKITLIVFCCILGIALPLIPVVVYTVRAVTKKEKLEVVDIILLVADIVWLICGIIALILLI